MKIGRRLAAAIAVPVLVAGAGLAVAGSAHAAAGAGIQPAVTDTWGFAGDEAAASTGTNFTHFSALVGAGTQYSPANPALPSVGFLGAPSTVWQTAIGPQVFLGLLNAEAAGLQFGAHGNETASLVVVRAGNRSDVVAVIVNQGQVHYDVLASYPMADTVDLDLLHDANSAFTFRGRHIQAGGVAFSTEDVHTGISSVKTIDSSGVQSGAGIIRSSFHTALGGILSGAREAQGGVSSFTSNPVPDTTGGIVVRLAHLHLDANANAGETFSEGFQSGAAWDVIPYAASQNNRTVAESTVFASDHISVVELGPQH